MLLKDNPQDLGWSSNACAMGIGPFWKETNAFFFFLKHIFLKLLILRYASDVTSKVKTDYSKSIKLAV